MAEKDDDLRIIGENRQRFRDLNGFVETTSDAREIYEAVLRVYPERAARDRPGRGE